MRNAILLVSLMLIGCGDSGSDSDKDGANVQGTIGKVTQSNYVGIYDITGYTQNTASCDAEGEAKFPAAEGETSPVFNFALFNTYKTSLGELKFQFGSIYDCESLEKCRETDGKVAKSETVGVLGKFSESFFTGNDAEGYDTEMNFTGSKKDFNNPADKSCVNVRKENITLKFNSADKTFVLEKKVYELEDYESTDEKGWCNTEDAAKAAVVKCSSYEVFRGKFKEDI